MSGCSFNKEGRCNVVEHHFSPECPYPYLGVSTRHCVESHIQKNKVARTVGPVELSEDLKKKLEAEVTNQRVVEYKEPDDHDIQGAWLLPGVRVVNSSAIRKRIDSEGRWGFFVGLITGLLVALLVHFVEL